MYCSSRRRDFSGGWTVPAPAMQPLPGITSAWLLEQVPLKNKTLCTKQALVPLLRTRDVDILLALGAGDIDREVPVIAAMLNER